MKSCRRRAIAISVGARYYRRSDGCYSLSYRVDEIGIVQYPWYPVFPLTKFIEKIREIETEESE